MPSDPPPGPRTGTRPPTGNARSIPPAEAASGTTETTWTAENCGKKRQSSPQPRPMRKSHLRPTPTTIPGLITGIKVPPPAPQSDVLRRNRHVPITSTNRHLRDPLPKSDERHACTRDKNIRPPHHPPRRRRTAHHQPTPHDGYQPQPTDGLLAQRTRPRHSELTHRRTRKRRPRVTRGWLDRRGPSYRKPPDPLAGRRRDGPINRRSRRGLASGLLSDLPIHPALATTGRTITPSASTGSTAPLP